MTVPETLYDWGLRAGWRSFPRALAPAKLRRGLERREDVVARIRRWAEVGRRPGTVLWIHAPSVGEGLQSQPVIEALRARRPDIQVFYTHTSPSAEQLVRRMRVSYADFLPLDVLPDMAAALDAVRPAAIVFGRTDVWPTLSRLAKQRGIGLALINATLAPGSSRLRPLARAFLSPAYRRLDAIGAIAPGDADRLTRLGVRRQRIQVTGDARFDQVTTRAEAIDGTDPPVSLLSGYEGPTLVAGSTWREDERRLLPALGAQRRRAPGLRVILVPHEPEEKGLRRLEEELGASGFRPVRYSALERGHQDQERAVDRERDRVRPAGPDAVVVDRVGLLAEIYAVADVAYVGGGFAGRGLHSVLEPAALGVPVLFGPRHGNAAEAAELIERGGAVDVAGATELRENLDRWLSNPEARTAAGHAARGYVRAQRGAGRKNAELVLRLLGELAAR